MQVPFVGINFWLKALENGCLSPNKVLPFELESPLNSGSLIGVFPHFEGQEILCNSHHCIEFPRLNAFRVEISIAKVCATDEDSVIAGELSITLA